MGVCDAEGCEEGQENNCIGGKRFLVADFRWTFASNLIIGVGGAPWSCVMATQMHNTIYLEWGIKFRALGKRKGRNNRGSDSQIRLKIKGESHPEKAWKMMITDEYEFIEYESAHVCPNRHCSKAWDMIVQCNHQTKHWFNQDLMSIFIDFCTLVYPTTKPR